ncbi:hypothetical protein L6452_22296 [Arctium lappa]|uniref:Uncharacterized protein n=1 Tax=Arctium lappa TaxID=4217 RepID=A0ACB9AZP2_ARCLA|nr:hypothetical protein L6452_22296 [Arctium lappa]
MVSNSSTNHDTRYKKRLEDGSKLQDALGDVVGRHTVPQVFINGKHIGGSVDTVIAYKNGELATLIGVDSSGRVEL